MPRLNVKRIVEIPHYTNTINYVAKKDKCSKPMYGAYNAYLPMNRSDIVPAIREQFDAAKTFYGKENRRPGIHFEINFAPEELEYLDPHKILTIGYWISETEFTDCMTYFAVHDHTKLWHLDMLINPVLITEGNMYGCNNVGWYGIGSRLCEHLKYYMPEDKIRDLQVSFSEKNEVQ